MPTLRQILANQANSKLSSGPQSPNGKLHSSANAFRHGLTAEQFVLISEREEHYDEHRRRLIKDLKPVGAAEKIQVERLAQVQWQIQRGQLGLSELLNTEISQVISEASGRKLRDLAPRIE